MKSDSPLSPLFNETEDDDEECWANKIMKIANITVSECSVKTEITRPAKNAFFFSNRFQFAMNVLAIFALRVSDSWKLRLL